MGKAKDAAPAAAKEEEEEGNAAAGRLAQLRPKRRVVFFLVFLLVNVWFVLVYNPCGIAQKKKKRVDCGWSGVSQVTCLTWACMFQPVEGKTFNIKVDIPKGQKLGMKVDTNAGQTVIKELKADGAIVAHNNNQSADASMQINIGDRIIKVNGHAGEGIKAELARQKPTAKFEIARPTSFVEKNMPMWLSDYPVGKVLVSAGFQRWLESFSRIGGVGFFSWFLSGYPVASLPVYYLGVSGVSSWYMSRCCYHERQDSPHCFGNGVPDFTTGIALAWNQTTIKRAKTGFGWMP